MATTEAGAAKPAPKPKPIIRSSAVAAAPPRPRTPKPPSVYIPSGGSPLASGASATSHTPSPLATHTTTTATLTPTAAPATSPPQLQHPTYASIVGSKTAVPSPEPIQTSSSPSSSTPAAGWHNSAGGHGPSQTVPKLAFARPLPQAKAPPLPRLRPPSIIVAPGSNAAKLWSANLSSTSPSAAATTPTASSTATTTPVATATSQHAAASTTTAAVQPAATKSAGTNTVVAAPVTSATTTTAAAKALPSAPVQTSATPATTTTTQPKPTAAAPAATASASTATTTPAKPTAAQSKGGRTTSWRLDTGLHVSSAASDESSVASASVKDDPKTETASSSSTAEAAKKPTTWGESLLGLIKGKEKTKASESPELPQQGGEPKSELEVLRSKVAQTDKVTKALEGMIKRLNDDIKQRDQEIERLDGELKKEKGRKKGGAGEGATTATGSPGSTSSSGSAEEAKLEEGKTGTMVISSPFQAVLKGHMTAEASQEEATQLLELWQKDQANAILIRDLRDGLAKKDTELKLLKEAYSERVKEKETDFQSKWKLEVSNEELKNALKKVLGDLEQAKHEKDRIIEEKIETERELLLKVSERENALHLASDSLIKLRKELDEATMELKVYRYEDERRTKGDKAISPKPEPESYTPERTIELLSLLPPAPNKFVALYDFVGASDLELSLIAGQIIEEVMVVDDEWMRGRIGDSTGMFPNNYVEELVLPTDASAFSSSTHIPKARDSIIESSITDEDIILLIQGEREAVLKQQQGAASSGAGSQYQPKSLTAAALYNFEASNDSEVSFIEGEYINVLEWPEESEWWFGEVRGTTGYFPRNYVQLE